jgi:hypothetical protein
MRWTAAPGSPTLHPGHRRHQESAMTGTKTYSGGCHCGNVRFDVTADLGQVIECNCSICSKHGLLWAFVKPEKFALRSSHDDELTEYRFHRKAIRHLFCPVCGVESFARGTMPDGSEMVAINVRCLQDVDLKALKTMPVDGKSF